VARLVRALAVVPRPAGCEKLAGVEGRLRIRQGQYRVLYSIDDTLRVIELVTVGHRREIYRGAS
jgi:mRNA interferase RelE/StbE